MHVDLAPSSAIVVRPRPVLSPHRAHDLTVYAQLLARWSTLHEIADPRDLEPAQAWKIIKRLARTQPVFRRQRKAAKSKPFEYRVYPRALNVRLVES
jgi:predicted transcriptional regulator